MNSSLVLGTAQLGSSYGITNKTGQPGQDTANAIIHEAWKNGICEFDTAQGYGNSEEALGKALSALGLSDEARIISKFDPELDHLNITAMINSVDKSLSILGVPDLFCMMLHRDEMLPLWNNGLAEVLHNVVLSGKVKHIGISVYSPDKAIQALHTDSIDIVQLPSNILDRRFEKAGVFELAEKKGKKIYIRSIFLQGLILMDSKDIPDNMSFARPVIEKLESFSVDLNISRQELAMCYIKSEMPGAKVVFGTDTPGQVRENLACWGKELPSSFVPEAKKLFNNVDEKILNPSLWSN